MNKEIIKIFTMNFWGRFNLHNSFLGYLLQMAFGQFQLADSEETADIVFTSVYNITSIPKFKYKTIWLIWENIRPNFDLANYAISCDFDDYGGRNVRCPLWYAELKWPGYDPPIISDVASNHGYEPPIDLESISLERKPKIGDRREKFCCFVANNPERHRILAVELLSRVEKVDVYGNVVGSPLKRSKYAVLPIYKFNICFENSIFPGYYTEKPLQAWAGGCVPLYFADRFASMDFNPAAIVNRADFLTLSDFVEHVRRINSSPDAVAEIVSQPLVLKRPSLGKIINFLSETYAKIRRDTRTHFAINIPFHRLHTR